MRAARRYAGLIFCLFFAGAAAGCIETIVHTTGGGFWHRPARGVSPSNPEKIKKSLFPNSRIQTTKKSKSLFKTSKVYTPHAGNSTKINPVNQITTAYTFLGITLYNLPIVFVPINVYNKVNLKSKLGGNEHGNQTYG